MRIHKTALIEENTKISDKVKIDAYAIIRQGSIIESNTKIGTHVEIGSNVKIGKNNKIFKNAYIGAPAQDRGYDTNVKNGPNKILVELGDNNIVREYVTIHYGTKGKTVLKDNNYLMSYSHIGHDCEVGSNVTLANYVSLGGHAIIEDYVFISAHSLIHQKTKVGTLSMIGALCPITQDVPPYSLIANSYGKLIGLNSVGLRRHTNLSAKQKLSLKKAFKILYKYNRSKEEGILELGRRGEEFKDIEEQIKKMISIFGGERGVLRKWRV